MREIPSSMQQAWNLRDFSGERRNIARVTIQQAQLTLHDFGYNIYASLPFGATQAPVELPNVRSLSWDRSADAEVASGSLNLYNTAALPLGTIGYRDLDQPGYFTFNRGGETFSLRWGHTPNEWSGLIQPDNILRTYEGYGINPAVCPEDDPHLVQTGTWLIDTVAYGHDGTIAVTFRDLGRVLIDQVIFPPITPDEFYPFALTRDTVQSGFVAGKTFTKVVTKGGDYDPKKPPPGGWAGPSQAPEIAGLESLDNGFRVRIGPQAAATAAAETAGLYQLDGFGIAIDNVELPTVYTIPVNGTPEQRTVTVRGGLINGNFYLVQAYAIYRETATGRRFAGNRSNDLFASPTPGGGPNVVHDSVLRDTDADGNQNVGETHPGQLVWRYRATGNPIAWRVIFYYTPTVDRFIHDGLVRQVENFRSDAAPVGTEQIAVFQTTRTDPGNTLSDWNILIYGASVRGGDNMYVAGGGFSLFKPTGGEFYRPPVAGAPPQEAGKATGATVTTKNGTVLPLGSATVRPSYHTSSNAFYYGNDPLFGHKPADAFDGNGSTYFLSVGNVTPGRGFAFEWIQGKLDRQTLVGVRFSTVKAGYTAYISVLANGQWIQFNDKHVIPYDANDPESHNGANIPYAATTSVDSEGTQQVIFRQPIPGATRVRVTLRNLQDFGLGEFRYRGAVRELTCVAINSASPPGPVIDVTSDTVASTYTVTEPPKVEPGLGQKPGKYYDYTDIIKILCAWGGFFWPEGGKQLTSCGEEISFSYGPAPYGLPRNIDPVLGENAGRVWGDFQTSGTGGVSDLPASVFDKKSLLDGIVYVREILGFLFYIDEVGSVVWKLPNIFSVGNDVGVVAQGPARTNEVVMIDEMHTLLGLTATLDSRNVRERVFISNTDGTAAALAQGYNPNPIGLRRVGGWTDQHFKTTAEARKMAGSIALRQLFTHRTDRLTIPAFPRIQINDQVLIYERVTSEGFHHYVKSITSSNDMEAGSWTYDLATHWLGTDPFKDWIFFPDDLQDELREYLEAIDVIPPRPKPPAVPASAIVNGEQDMARYVRVDGNPRVYITNGIHRRAIDEETERVGLAAIGLVPTAKVEIISQTHMDRLILVGPE